MKPLALALDQSDLLWCEVGGNSSSSSSSSEAVRPVPVALPRGLAIVRGLLSEKFSARILARLAEAENRSEVATDQQDYRIAWLTVLRAADGNLDPWRQAFWEIVGNSPEKAIPFWLASHDAAADEYFPLSMLPIRYTKDWASEYLRGKVIAERARLAELPPKKEPRSILPKLREKRPKGFSMWPELACVLTFCAVAVLWMAGRTKETYFFAYPDNPLRIVQNLDPCLPDGSCGKRYIVQAVVDGKPDPETEMHFSEPQHFEAGHTFKWIRYTNLGSVQVIDGYDVLRDENTRLPILPPNCSFDWSTPKGHVVCQGGKAKFE